MLQVMAKNHIWARPCLRGCQSGCVVVQIGFWGAMWLDLKVQEDTEKTCPKKVAKRMSPEVRPKCYRDSPPPLVRFGGSREEG